MAYIEKLYYKTIYDFVKEYCYLIRWATHYETCKLLSTTAANKIRAYHYSGYISGQAERFLNRKLLCAMVESSSMHSEVSTVFGQQKKYDPDIQDISMITLTYSATD